MDRGTNFLHRHCLALHHPHQVLLVFLKLEGNHFDFFILCRCKIPAVLVSLDFSFSIQNVKDGISLILMDSAHYFLLNISEIIVSGSRMDTISKIILSLNKFSIDKTVNELWFIGLLGAVLMFHCFFQSLIYHHFTIT